MRFRQWHTGLISLIATVLLGPFATSPVIAAQASGGLEEIVVSATRRSENLQNVPIAVTAISAEQLEHQNVTDFFEVVDRVPGFMMNADNITEPNMFMRGIGTDIEASAANPSVAIFVDDVYISRAGGTLGELWDLDRVEVLRGPQSTLYGKNVVGGLVHFITHKPTREFQSKLDLTLGNYDLLTVRGAISGPISERVAGSIALSTRTHSGYAQNTASGNDMEDLDAKSARAHLRFMVSDDLDVLLSGDFTRRRGTGRYNDITYSPRNAAFINPERRKGPISGPLDGPSGDGRADVDDGGLSLRIDWKNSLGTLTSLTAYRNSRLVGQENTAATYFDFANIIPYDTDNLSVPDDFYFQTKSEDAKQFSQEFRLASTGTGPWSWLGGVYYLHEQIDRQELVDFLFPDIFWYEGTENTVGNTKADGFGIFGEATYAWQNGFGLTVGARYSNDKKHYDYAHTGDPVNGDYHPPYTPPDGFTAQTSGSWDALTPNLVLSYKPQEDQFYFFRAARGYKSGGFAAESDALDPGQAKVPFDPEYALNLELGAKLEFLEHRVRLNGSIYQTTYTDLQTQQFITVTAGSPPDEVIVNAGEATARGLELEVTALPVKGWQVTASYAYLDCELTGDLILEPPFSAPVNLKGNTCRRSPKGSFNLGTRAEWQAGSMGTASFDLNYSWTDKFYFDNENNPLTNVDAQFSLDASFGLQFGDGPWSLSVWGKNLTDELNISGRSLVGLPAFEYTNYEYIGNNDTRFDSYLAPRTYGITVRRIVGR